MSKFIFIHEDEGRRITHEIDEVQLPEIVASFEEFLKGCGFYFEGKTLDVIDDETNDIRKHTKKMLLG
jgi:hypothetical protein